MLGSAFRSSNQLLFPLTDFRLYCRYFRVADMSPNVCTAPHGFWTKSQTTTIASVRDRVRTANMQTQRVAKGRFDDEANHHETERQTRGSAGPLYAVRITPISTGLATYAGKHDGFHRKCTEQPWSCFVD